MFRHVPPLSLIPLLILWFGIGELPKTIIIVLASFFPMYLNMDDGFRGVTGSCWKWANAGVLSLEGPVEDPAASGPARDPHRTPGGHGLQPPGHLSGRK